MNLFEEFNLFSELGVLARGISESENVQFPENLRNLRKFPDDRSAIDERLSHHEAHEGHEALGDRLSKISCAAYSKGQPQGGYPDKPDARILCVLCALCGYIIFPSCSSCPSWRKPSFVLWLRLSPAGSFVVVDPAGRISTEVDTSIVRLDTSTGVSRFMAFSKAAHASLLTPI